jgi:hypothetical protein
MKIVRFLKFVDAKRVLSECSTFVLNSSLYYRQMGWENNDEIGDKNENDVAFENNKRRYELLAATLLSCWTELGGDELPPADWELFSDRKNGIAIVSTVESVDHLLRNLVRKVLGLADEGMKWGWNFDHAKVIYYDGLSHPPEFDTMVAWKWKLDRYAIQREYRFAFLAGSPRMHLQTIVFQVEDAGSYIESIHFGPTISTKERDELVAGAIAGNLAGRIRNFDALYGGERKYYGRTT